MATLVVKADPDDELQGYTIEIDGLLAVAFPARQGSVNIPGACGDGVQHRADYTFFGPAGAKLSFKVFCAGSMVNVVHQATIPVHTAPSAADFSEFTK